MVKHKYALPLLFAANGVSGFAQGISMLAIPWYFTRINQSSTFNLAYGVVTVAVLFFGLYAGTLVDKYSRKANFLGNSLVCGVLLLGIGLMGYFNQHLHPAAVVAVFAITMFNYNIHYPNLYAFGQEISHPSEYGKVNANIEVVGQSTSILSGGIAAIMLDGFSITDNIYIKAWDIWDIILLNAGTYFISVILIWFIPYTPKAITIIHDGVIGRIKVGFRFLMANRGLLWFGLFSYSVFAMLLVEIHAVLPAYVGNHLQMQGSVFAIADGIYAVGALLAGLLVNTLFKNMKVKHVVIMLTALTAGIFIWTFATKSVAVVYTMSILLGFSNAGIRVMRLTYLFKHVPNEVMGRVNSIFNMANVLLRSIFIFIFSLPFFTFGNQIIWAYLIMALFLIFSALILLIQKHSPEDQKQHVHNS
ncbi:MAG: MFS transporter [Bacteroidia bacterium]|jgi:MFS family permease|nr:MFS transporter [Bacteroidia bacterium]